MSLLNRQPKPIPTRDRDPSSLRDDRLFIIACDDTYAPQQYFGFFRLTQVQIHVVPTLDNTSSAEAVLKRLLDYEYEESDDCLSIPSGTSLPELKHQSFFLCARYALIVASIADHAERIGEAS